MSGEGSLECACRLGYIQLPHLSPRRPIAGGLKTFCGNA
jgi:hypothetical protein